ncbi:hypothetical protein ACWEAF_41140, partial [Streptomyces sp. NPDC005071]
TPQAMRSTGGESHANSGGRAPHCEATKKVMGRPHSVLYGCAREIDEAVSTLARLLGDGASV